MLQQTLESEGVVSVYFTNFMILMRILKKGSKQGWGENGRSGAQSDENAHVMCLVQWYILSVISKAVLK